MNYIIIPLVEFCEKLHVTRIPFDRFIGRVIKNKIFFVNFSLNIWFETCANIAKVHILKKSLDHIKII